MDGSRRQVLFALAAGLGASLAGCSQRAPLRIAGHPWPGYEPLFLAESQQLLPKQVALTHYPTIKASIDALREARADAAMLTLDEVLTLQVGGLDLQVILVMDVSKGADALVARRPLPSLAQLAGQRVGLEPSTLGELMLSMILEKAGLKRNAITPVLLPYESQEAAFKSGAVDALITYEPVVGRLTAAGAVKLLSTRELPDAVFDVLAVRTEMAPAYTQALQQCLLGHFKVVQQLRRNPWDTAYRMVTHAGVSAEELMDAFRGLELPDLVANQSYLSIGNGHLRAIVDKLSGIMVAAGTLPRPADAGRLFTDAYLPRSMG